jgi:hypothetical protein
VQCGFLNEDLTEQFFRSVYCHRVEDACDHPAVTLNPLIEIGAFVAHAWLSKLC